MPAGQVGKLALALADLGLGRTAPAGGGRLAFVHRRVGRLEVRFLLVQPGDDGAVVGDHALLAGDVVGKLGEAAVEFGEAGPDAALFGGQRFRRQRDALGRGRGTRRGVAEVGHARRRNGLARGGLGLLARPLVGAGGGLGERRLRIVQGLVGGERPQVQHRRLGPANLARQIAIAHRLACLALEPVELLLDLADHVVEARQVLFGAAQPQLRLVAAIVQAGDARRFFQQRAAVGRLGGDQLADLALADDRRRMGTGRCIGKQKLHVAGAHIAPVDAVDRAGLALDAARHLERIGVVEGRRRDVVGVVDGERHLGGVARRAVAAALEDDVVHAGGAHGLV